MKHIRILTAFVLAAAFAQPAWSAEEISGNQQSSDQAGPAVKLHGVINSINAAAGRVNITHDPVPELKWPTMKMNFKVRDPAMLKDLKPSMTVDFEIQKIDNQYLVIRIGPAQ